MKTHTFLCPHCHRKLEAQADWIGQESPCPFCNQRFTISQHLIDLATNGTEMCLCPKCKGTFIIREEQIGQPINCPNCSFQFLAAIKASVSQEEENPIEVASPEEEPPYAEVVLQEETGHHQRRHVLFSVLAGLALIVLILGISLAYFFRQHYLQPQKNIRMRLENYMQLVASKDNMLAKEFWVDPAKATTPFDQVAYSWTIKQIKVIESSLALATVQITEKPRKEVTKLQIQFFVNTYFLPLAIDMPPSYFNNVNH